MSLFMLVPTYLNISGMVFHYLRSRGLGRCGAAMCFNMDQLSRQVHLTVVTVYRSERWMNVVPYSGSDFQQNCTVFETEDRRYLMMF